MLSKDSTILSTQKLFTLTISGAAIFWVTTVATSLLPLAAEYRAAYSNWNIQTVWVDSAFVGLLFGFGVSYFLLRSLRRTPTKDPITEAAKLGAAALVLATVLIDIPRSLLAAGPGDALYYFLVGLMFNAARFLLLGLAIGYVYKRL
jgi:hypothetical protein